MQSPFSGHLIDRSLDTCSYGEMGRNRMSPIPVRPLSTLLAYFALAAASIPGFRRVRLVGRGVVLGAVAVYAWMVVRR